MIKTLATVLALGAVLPAQTAAYRLFGTSCQHTTVPPITFRNLGTPVLGTTFFVETDASRPPIGASNDYYLLTGASSTSYRGLPLPFQTEVLMGPGVIWCGTLYVSLDVVQRVPVLPWPQLAQTPFRVPASAALLGMRFYQQVLYVNTSPFDRTFALSAAGEGTIGR